MKKIFPYTCATILLASSTNAIMAGNQIVNVETAPLQDQNSTSIYQSFRSNYHPEGTQTQMETAKEYVSELLNDEETPIIERIDLAISGKTGSEIIEEALDKMEESFLKVLALPDREFKKIYNNLDGVTLFISQLEQELNSINKRKNKISGSFDPKKKIPSITNTKKRRIFEALYTFSNKNDAKIIRNDLKDKAELEITYYYYLKEIETDSFKDKYWFQKLPYRLFNSLNYTYNQPSETFEAVKYNAQWYETTGRTVNLNNPELSQNILDWIEHTKQCLEFLKQENIQ